jgi:hypothetical protein
VEELGDVAGLPEAGGDAVTVRLAGVAALGLAVLACLRSPTAPRGVPLGQEFELGTGEAAVFDDDLRVTFERVVSV